MVRSMLRLVALSVIAASFVPAPGSAGGTVASLAHRVLTPIAECEEGDEFCVVLGLEATDRQSLETRREGKTIVKSFSLAGSLNGGKARPFELRFVLPADDYFALTKHSGPIAADTRGWADDQVIVSTAQGSLRIDGKNVRYEATPGLSIIDTRRRTVVARYYRPCIDLSFLTRRAPFFDEGRGRCVAVGTDGRTRFVATCARPQPRSCEASLPKSFGKAIGVRRDDVVALVREYRGLGLSENDPQGGEFGGSGWGLKAYRVANTHFLVLRGWCGDCDG